MRRLWITSCFPLEEKDVIVLPSDLVILSGFTSGFHFLASIFSFKNYYSGTFPADDAPVSDDLITACALVDESLWEKLGSFLLSQGDLHYIREHIDHNCARVWSKC